MVIWCRHAPNHQTTEPPNVMKPFLKIDDHLTLHLPRPELAAAIFAAVEANRPYLRQWLPWVDATTKVEDTEKFMEESTEHNRNGTRLTTFLLAGEELAGSLGVVTFNRDHKKCEIGYWLREDLQGEGLMTKALARFIDHLFSTKDLNRVEILVASENCRSQAVPLRLGFTREGTLRQGLLLRQEYLDLELFSLLRREWKPL